MGKKEAEVLRLRRRLKARRVKHNAIISLMNHTLRRRDMTQFALCVQCLVELGRGSLDWVLDPSLQSPKVDPPLFSLRFPPAAHNANVENADKRRSDGVNCHLSNNAKNRDVDHRITQ